MTNLTRNQIELLEVFANCEMNGANGSIEYLLSDSGDAQMTWTYLWADERASAMGVSEQVIGGILTSLQNEGMISMLRPGKGAGCSGDKDGSFIMTPEGFAAWKAQRGETLAQLPEETSTTKETEMTNANFIVKITSKLGLTFDAPIFAADAAAAIREARAAVKLAGISRKVGQINFRAVKA